MSKIAMINFYFPEYSIESEMLTAAGHEVSVFHGDSLDEVAPALEDTEVLFVQLEPVRSEHLARMNKLRMIAREGIGVDSIDLQAATLRGIPVMNVPDYCLEEVAVHACSMLLSAHRKLTESSRLVQAGGWTKAEALKPITALSQLTLGLIGMGRIGAQVIDRMRGFGCRIVVSDPFLKPGDVPEGVELVGLDDLFALSDFISIHCPLTEDTRHLINRTNIAKMKKRPILINVSRGPIVHETDLLTALDDGTISFAALDVLEKEPPLADHPLLAHSKALVTNHIAWYSEQSELRMRKLTTERVIDFLEGRPIPNVVNERLIRELRERKS